MANQQATEVFSLLQVCNSIKATFAGRYKSKYWVKAEMNKLNIYKYSGHAYPELVEKQNGKIVAQMRAIIWKSDFERINQLFKDRLTEPLREGIKILCLCNITFDPVYGLTLRIHDIDVNYTLGDLENEKKLSIEQLKKEQLFDKNRQLPFPILPKRIAVISVETSKGYADFLKVIQDKSHAYQIEHTLFPCLLQGDKAVKSMLKALHQIEAQLDAFDVVAIVRGGGAEIGLSCFNHIQLSKAICQFPLPVLSGIGHATNETVCELVTYMNLITPTALGNFIVEKFYLVDEYLNHSQSIIYQKSLQLIQGFQLENQIISKQLWQYANQMLSLQKMSLMTYPQRLLKAANNSLITKRADLQHHTKLLYTNVNNTVKAKSESLEQLSAKINYLSPQSTFKRGYSITLYKGKPINTVSLNLGAELETLLEGMTIVSEIKEVKHEETKI